MNSPRSRKFFNISTGKRDQNRMSSDESCAEQKRMEVPERDKKSRSTNFLEILFKCECDDLTCLKLIWVSTDEYAHTHRKNRHFIVIPSHVNTSREAVLERFSNYAVVEKFFKGASS